MPDDRRVGQQEQRFSNEGKERRHGKPKDLPLLVGGIARRAAGIVRHIAGIVRLTPIATHLRRVGGTRICLKPPARRRSVGQLLLMAVSESEGCPRERR